MTQNTTQPTAVLVGIQLPTVDDVEHEASMAELARLVETLGYRVVGKISQKRPSLAADTAIGAGKLEELARFTGGSGKVIRNIPGKKSRSKTDENEPSLIETAMATSAGDDESELSGHFLAPASPETKAEFVIFDNELSPTQIRNLESATNVEILDRTGVIVEIFYRHARSRESRLQVEMARLRYLAPRLRMMRGASERQGGGIGAKGVGETAHELDRRRIRDRIAELGRELAEIHTHHAERRQNRHELPTVALVGYTNAGKSSLMRALTGSEVLVADKLFATLDTTVRSLQPPSTPKIMVTDTVGFIKKLPHDLVASFRSTLDEARQADLLLFVVDGSDPTYRQQLSVTKEVLAGIGASDIPSVLVINKIDRVDDAAKAILTADWPEAMLISTRNPDDVRLVWRRIVAFFERDMIDATLHIPFTQGRVVSEIRQAARIISESHDDTGVLITIRASQTTLNRFAAWYGPKKDD